MTPSRLALQNSAVGRAFRAMVVAALLRSLQVRVTFFFTSSSKGFPCDYADSFARSVS
jgi:hypothetical protein